MARMAEGHFVHCGQHGSEIAHLTIPDSGPAEPFFQLDLRPITQFTLGSPDVECPVLPVPIDPAGKNRWCDAKRLAELLDNMANCNDRQHRIMGNSHRHIEGSRDGMHKRKASTRLSM